MVLTSGRSTKAASQTVGVNVGEGNLNLLGCKNHKTMWVLLAWPTALGFQEPHLLLLLEFANVRLRKSSNARSAKINCSSCQPFSRVLHLATQSSHELSGSKKQTGYSRPSQQLAPNQ